MKFVWFTLILLLSISCKKKEIVSENKIQKISVTGNNGIIKDSCFYTNLSNTYNYKIIFSKLKELTTKDSFTVQLIIINRNSNKTVDTFFIESNDELFDINFSECGDVRSYSKSVNTEEDIVDNDYGDLIISDFNFDSLEDIAIINDRGFYNGPRYSFLTQMSNQKFEIDTFLTNNLVFFPDEIDTKTKSLISKEISGAHGLEINIYKLNQITRKYFLKSSKYIQINN